ncbi:MAG: Gfo/Idh/MocA family oxidoreductase, partial [Candidatus Omnitrophica bacterium]|nr:Gfo/Idh/MocA family oxidoreductase [Candidatus Omnitrophota bacterium]
MKKVLRIGIVGCGAIGTSLARIIVKDFSSQARLTAVYDQDTGRASAVAKKIVNNRLIVVNNLKSAIARCDLVIESAGAKCSFDVASAALSAGKDILVMSVGGVAGRVGALTKLAGEHGAGGYIPSGAIC